MSNKVYNITTNFALPLLGWRRSVFEPFLVNAYIYHEEVEHFRDDHLFVLIKEDHEHERFKLMEDAIINSQYHVTQYYVDEKQMFSMHVFRFADSRVNDYKLFLDGKYSRMSDYAKDLIRMNSKKNGINYRVLDRSPDLRALQQKKIGTTKGSIILSEEDEVWSSIHDANNIKDEVFRSEMLDSLMLS